MLAETVLAMTAMSSPQDLADVDRLKWMGGDWVCEQHGGLFYESWSPPQGGTMQGHGQLVVDGKTTFMEFLSIEPGEKGPVMHILLGAPSKGAPSHARFLLESVEREAAVFQRLDAEEGDFPMQITYARQSVDGLACMLHGAGKMEKYAFRKL